MKALTASKAPQFEICPYVPHQLCFKAMKQHQTVAPSEQALSHVHHPCTILWETASL